MKDEFLIERQGKTFVLYAGILDLAHTQGLKSISTEILQIPNETNNRTAICMATVTLEKDGVIRVFTGIGDAAANNVAPAMQTCLIRMAETRAKARALRDATNIGVTAFEELGADDDAPAPSRRQAAPPRQQETRPAPVNRQPTPRTAAPAGIPPMNDVQRRKLAELITTGEPPRDDLNFNEAAELIKKLTYEKQAAKQ